MKQYYDKQRARRLQQLLIKNNKETYYISGIMLNNSELSLILLNMGLMLSNVKQFNTSLNRYQIKILIFANMVLTKGFNHSQYCKTMNLDPFQNTRYLTEIKELQKLGYLLHIDRLYYLSAEGKKELIKIAYEVGKYLKEATDKINELS